jgi:aminoglycoside phosphotransferase (APT) family kinase protein
MAEQDDVKGIRATAVSDWLQANVEGARGPFRFSLITGGHSNLTYLVEGADARRYVLRRPPLGAVLATAHDMAREHRIIGAVGATSVPVPPALALCEDETVNDAPFYVMAFVDGHVLENPDQTATVFPDQSQRVALGESVIDTLAMLHTTDPDAIGLGDLGRKEAYLERQLRRWQTQWEKSKTRELAAMEETHELLVAARPEQKYTGIVHGDYRLGNMLVRAPGAVAAVLDWELCTLGDVLADVGYLLNSWGEPGEGGPLEQATMPTLAGGFATRAELVRRYAEATGFEVGDVDYYRAFQNWRLAAIIEGVMARYLKGVMGDPNADVTIFRMRIDKLAEDALATMRRLAG